MHIYIRVCACGCVCVCVLQTKYRCIIVKLFFLACRRYVIKIVSLRKWERDFQLKGVLSNCAQKNQLNLARYENTSIVGRQTCGIMTV